jgi:hypothetical protein
MPNSQNCSNFSNNRIFAVTYLSELEYFEIYF